MAKRARNEGTIYRKTVIRNGKEYTYWESQVSVGYDKGTGKRIRKTYTGDSQKDVRAKMQEAAVAVEKNDYFEPSRATLGEWLDIWLDIYCPRIKYQTRKHYAAQCNTHIKPALGAIPLGELSVEQIQAFYADLEREGRVVRKTDRKTGRIVEIRSPLSPKSIKNVHSVLSKALNTAVKLKYIRYNPASQTERPKVPKPDISPLTNEQIALVLSEIEIDELKNLYKLILFAGLRKAEALGLTWTEINFNESEISINHQLVKRRVEDGGYTLASVKQDRRRSITVSPYVMDALRDQQRIQQADKDVAGDLWQTIVYESGKPAQLVFTKSDGTPINPKAAYIHYNKIAKRYGIDASRVHDLRHTFAVLSLQNGDDIKTIQENHGHASASFTLDTYAHRTSQMQKDSASRMQNFIDALNAPKRT